MKLKIYMVVLLIIFIFVLSSFLASISLFNQKNYARNTVTEIVFTQDQLNVLNTEFSVSTTEVAYCLYGSINNEVAYVTIMKKADITDSYMDEDSMGITIKNCESDKIAFVYFTKSLFNIHDIIGVIHNHPNGVCKMSPKDIYSFGTLSYPTNSIICGIDDIATWTPDDLIEPITISLAR